jgi:putative alpha-1,2-mannosidase
MSQGWNRASSWTVYFCGRFNVSSSYKTFIGADFTTDDLVDFSDEPSYESDSARLGALFTFTDSAVLSRVGISFISANQACSNIDAEIPADQTLQNVVDQTKAAWTNEVFSKVTTTETNATKLNQLYTALYFMHLLPTNKTGENPNWESEEPYYDDIFTFWDIVSLQSLIFAIAQH